MMDPTAFIAPANILLGYDYDRAKAGLAPRAWRVLEKHESLAIYV